MRPPTACVICRNAKRRCDRENNLVACSRCLGRHMQCPTVAVSPQLPRLSLTNQSPSYSPSIHEKDEVLYLVHLYFRFIHDSPRSLFHEPTFKVSVVEGNVSQPVLLAMLGLSARYLTSSNVPFNDQIARPNNNSGLPRNPISSPVDRCIVPRPLQP